MPENYRPIRVEDPAAIPDPLRLARSLRLLLRWVEVGEPRVLGEVETVERIAQTGIWQLALRPDRELMFDVALVFDASPSMALWLRLSQDVRRLLSRYGEFRNLYWWKLVATESGALGLRSPRRETIYPTSRLRTNDRRRIVLVMSDCMAPFWRRQGIANVLHDWARSMPTAILQVLPEHLWRRTALGQVSPVQLRLTRHYDRVGLPSQNLTATAHSFLERRRIDAATQTDALRLPIVSLAPQPLRAWARMVAGDRQARVPGVLWTEIDPARSDLPLRNAEQSPSDRVDHFVRTASPLARELAALLAASPLVILPIVRLIQRALLPRSRASHVAEVFASGLFVVASAEPPTLDNAETVIYQLAEPGYRSRLLEPLPAIDRVLVVEKVSAYIVRGLGTSMSSFRAWLRDPRRAVSNVPDAVVADRAANFFSAFATVTADVLRGVGPEYAAFARQLEGAEPPAQPPAEPEGNAIALEEFESDVAVFERDDGPQFEAFEWESVETLAVLKRFEFEMAEIAIVERQPVITRSRASNWGYTETLGDEVGLDMMLIPAGTFWMGSPDNEPERRSFESPQHEVSVPEFFMGRFAVTQAQWRAVAKYPQINRDLDPDPSYFKGDARPVENVSWDDAIEFCQRLSAQTGREYRLPSEAEWEYGCRAGTVTPFHFGDLISTDLANYDGNYTYNNGPKGEYREQTLEVGRFPANRFGLHDMHGNVWEWCEDDWHGSYEGAPNDGSAWADENRTATNRLLRGGSWGFIPWHCRSACRDSVPRVYRFNFIGFRVSCASPSAL